MVLLSHFDDEKGAMAKRFRCKCLASGPGGRYSISLRPGFFCYSRHRGYSPRFRVGLCLWSHRPCFKLSLIAVNKLLLGILTWGKYYKLLYSIVGLVPARLLGLFKYELIGIFYMANSFTKEQRFGSFIIFTTRGILIFASYSREHIYFAFRDSNSIRIGIVEIKP